MISLTDWMEMFHKRQASEHRAIGTIKRYKFTFDLFRKFLSEADRPATTASLTTGVMEDFAIWLRDTPIRAQNGTTQRSESGIHAHLRDMRAFCIWLEKQDVLSKRLDFPMPRLPKRLYRLLTEEEMARLWESPYLKGTSSRAVRNRAMVSLMLDTGIRREEVANLKCKDLNLDGRTLTVIGKGDKERRVFFSKAVQQHLKDFLDIRGIDDAPLFDLSAQGIKTTFQRIKADVGLEKFHPHQLRHQCATTMVKNKTHGEHLMLLMGHEDYNTTRKYITLADDDLREAHEAASPYLSLVAPVEQPRPFRRVYSKGKAS